MHTEVASWDASCPSSDDPWNPDLPTPHPTPPKPANHCPLTPPAPLRIVKQPKARQAKSQARVNAFVELTERTRDMPKEDLKADFGQKGMIRQGVGGQGSLETPPIPHNTVCAQRQG